MKTEFHEPKVIDLKKYPEILKELKILARDNVSADSIQMKNSAFYKLIENANILDASRLTGYFSAPLTSQAVLLIAKVIATLSSITEVNFSDNHLSDDAIGVAYTLASSNSISVINFGNNNLRSHTPATAKCFSNSSCLHTLIMDNNKIGKDSPQTFEVIAKIATLRVLSLAGNEMTSEDLLASIKKIVKSQIHTLNISYLGFYSKDPEIIKKIAQSQIHTLNMRGNKLGPCGLKIIKSLIGSKIKNLDISANELGDDLLPISKELAKWSVCSVNFNQNFATSTNYPLIAKKLTKSRSLIKVKMFDKMQPEDRAKSEKIFNEANSRKREAMFIGTKCFYENGLPKELICKIIGDAQPFLIEYDMIDS